MLTDLIENVDVVLDDFDLLRISEIPSVYTSTFQIYTYDFNTLQKKLYNKDYTKLKELERLLINLKPTIYTNISLSDRPNIPKDLNESSLRERPTGRYRETFSQEIYYNINKTY
jgi:flagellin-specific chaperone FliS